MSCNTCNPNPCSCTPACNTPYQLPGPMGPQGPAGIPGNPGICVPCDIFDVEISKGFLDAQDALIANVEGGVLPLSYEWSVRTYMTISNLVILTGVLTTDTVLFESPDPTEESRGLVQVKVTDNGNFIAKAYFWLNLGPIT